MWPKLARVGGVEKDTLNTHVPVCDDCGVERKQRKKIIQRIKRIWPALLTGAALAGGFVPSAMGGEKLQRSPAVTVFDVNFPDPFAGIKDEKVSQNEVKAEANPDPSNQAVNRHVPFDPMSGRAGF